MFNQNNAFGNRFVETLDQYNDFGNGINTFTNLLLWRQKHGFNAVIVGLFLWKAAHIYHTTS